MHHLCPLMNTVLPRSPKTQTTILLPVLVTSACLAVKMLLFGTSPTSKSRCLAFLYISPCSSTSSSCAHRLSFFVRPPLYLCVRPCCARFCRLPNPGGRCFLVSAWGGSQCDHGLPRLIISAVTGTWCLCFCARSRIRSTLVAYLNTLGKQICRIASARSVASLTLN